MTRVTGAVFVTDAGDLMCWGCGEGIGVGADIAVAHVTQYVDATWHHACLIAYESDRTERRRARARRP